MEDGDGEERGRVYCCVMSTLPWILGQGDTKSLEMMRYGQRIRMDQVFIAMAGGGVPSSRI